MKQVRQNTYVERELRRRRIERRYRIISKVLYAIACVALVVVSEAILVFLLLRG